MLMLCPGNRSIAFITVHQTNQFEWINVKMFYLLLTLIAHRSFSLQLQNWRRFIAANFKTNPCAYYTVSYGCIYNCTL